jgi:hypothetical protein
MLSYKFDEEAVLRELGFEASNKEVQDQILQGIYEQLDRRVGDRLLTSLSADELNKFDELISNKKEADQAQTWLSHRFPEYQQICDEELERLIVEIRSYGDAAVAIDKSSTS